LDYRSAKYGWDQTVFSAQKFRKFLEKEYQELTGAVNQMNDSSSCIHDNEALQEEIHHHRHFSDGQDENDHDDDSDYDETDPLEKIEVMLGYLLRIV
jgi:hypothetical protein